MISIDSIIWVSSDTSFESHGIAVRRSESGGYITLHSGLTSGQAITLTENSDLESLLDDDAPGPGGAISIASEGGDITANGLIQVDRGTLTISNVGSLGAHPGAGLQSVISLDGANLTAEYLNISAAGVLNIGLESPLDIATPTMSLTANSDINLGSFASISAVRESSGDAMLSTLGSINFFGPIDIERSNGGVPSGLNLSLQANGNISGNSNVKMLVDNGGYLPEGGTIAINAGASLLTDGLNLEIHNIGAQIGTGGNISVTAADLTAGAIDVKVSNQGGGLIDTGGTIDFNVSDGANVTDDASLQVLGSNGAGGAAININGGDYQVGGTFRTFVDGDGTIMFNNASAHADVLKAGVLGANGVLNVGGGVLSADTTLKLYASGSNGQLNFISDVTLGGNSTKILAANSVTISDNVVVTVEGQNAANVYTNNPNYSSVFGGNDSTTGTFAGAGANEPQPLSSAPPFDELDRPNETTRGPANEPNPSGPRHGRRVINVSDSGELLSLVDNATTGSDGSLTIPNSNRRSNSRNSGRRNGADRANGGRATANVPTAIISQARASSQ